MDHCTLNWIDDFSYDDLEFKHVDVFVIEYESIFMDDELEYDVFDFDMLSVDFIIDIVSACDTSIVSLCLKTLANSLKFAFLDPKETLLVIIASDLD